MALGFQGVCQEATVQLVSEQGCWGELSAYFFVVIVFNLCLFSRKMVSGRSWECDVFCTDSHGIAPTVDEPKDGDR
jgi:hypothetical protein